MWLIRVVHTWSVEKHSMKCYAYLNKKISCYTLQRGSFVTSNAAGLTSCSTLTVTFYNSECCMPSEHDFSWPAAPFFLSNAPVNL